jgi:hypothetical protein
MNYRLSKHAIEEIDKRGITAQQLDGVLQWPGQKVEEYAGLVCYQSRILMNGDHFLLRVIVNESHDPAVVVTAYRTSKIDKYWRPAL